MKTYTHLEIVKHDPTKLPEDFDVVFDPKAPGGTVGSFARIMDKVILRLSDHLPAEQRLTGSGTSATIHIRGYRVPPKVRAIMQALDAAVEDLKKNPDGVHVIKVEL